MTVHSVHIFTYYSWRSSGSCWKVRFLTFVTQVECVCKYRWTVLGLGDTLMDNSFMENACDEKTNFHSFRSAELLFLFSISISKLLAQPLQPMLHIKIYFKLFSSRQILTLVLLLN